MVNRGMDGRPTFTDRKEFKRALQTIYFYQFSLPLLKLAKFLTFSLAEQKEFLAKMSRPPRLVEIFSYCPMPRKLDQIKHLVLGG